MAANIVIFNTWLDIIEDDEYEYGNEGEDESFGSSRGLFLSGIFHYTLQLFTRLIPYLESERGPQEGSSLSPNIFW